MKIFVINPNTSKSMTEHIYRELKHIKRVFKEGAYMEMFMWFIFIL